MASQHVEGCLGRTPLVAVAVAGVRLDPLRRLETLLAGEPYVEGADGQPGASPVGPATPVVDTAKSVPVRSRTPRAIATGSVVPLPEA